MYKSLDHVRKSRRQVALLGLAVAAPLGLDDPALMVDHQPVIVAYEARQQMADHIRLPIELRQRRLRSLVTGQLASPRDAVGPWRVLATGQQRIDLQLAQALG